MTAETTYDLRVAEGNNPQLVGYETYLVKSSTGSHYKVKKYPDRVEIISCEPTWPTYECPNPYQVMVYPHDCYHHQAHEIAHRFRLIFS